MIDFISDIYDNRFQVPVSAIKLDIKVEYHSSIFHPSSLQ